MPMTTKKDQVMARPCDGEGAVCSEDWACWQVAARGGERLHLGSARWGLAMTAWCVGYDMS